MLHLPPCHQLDRRLRSASVPNAFLLVLQGKVNQKNDMTLYNLDQFKRSRLPHYTGFKPQAAPNITMDQPSQGPTDATTSGSANHIATRGGLPEQDHSNYINGRTGIMTFFSRYEPCLWERHVSILGSQTCAWWGRCIFGLSGWQIPFGCSLQEQATCVHIRPETHQHCTSNS